MFKIKGTKSQGCCYCDKFKLVNNQGYSLKIANLIDVCKDGKGYMRCIALFIYKNENEYYRVRKEIANYLLTNYRQFENINIPTEEGEKNILDYFNYIRLPRKMVWAYRILCYKYLI